MSNVYDDRPVQESLDGVWSGIIASDASGVEDTVEVLIKAFSLEHRFGPCLWPLQGSKLPERGNQCVVVFDEKQRPFIMQWYPTDPTPETDSIAQVPIGMPMPWLVSTIPSGYREFDGSAIVEATHPVLHGLFGATIPDLRGKTLLGYDGSHAIGTTGGATTHTLTPAETAIRNHTHPPGTLGVAFPYASGPGSSSANSYVPPHNNTFSSVYQVEVTPSGATGNPTEADGAAHNNLPPYRTVKWITVAG